jgi:hypothetical protein
MGGKSLNCTLELRPMNLLLVNAGHTQRLFSLVPWFSLNGILIIASAGVMMGFFNFFCISLELGTLGSVG